MVTHVESIHHKQYFISFINNYSHYTHLLHHIQGRGPLPLQGLCCHITTSIFFTLTTAANTLEPPSRPTSAHKDTRTTRPVQWFLATTTPQSRSWTGEGKVVILQLQSVEGDLVSGPDMHKEVGLKLLKGHWRSPPQLPVRVITLRDCAVEVDLLEFVHVGRSL